MKTELLYTKSKDYWLDIQLNITECENCGSDLDPMKSYPVKNYTKPKTPRAYIFVCSSCQIKTVKKSLRKRGLIL